MTKRVGKSTSGMDLDNLDTVHSSDLYQQHDGYGDRPVALISTALTPSILLICISSMMATETATITFGGSCT